MSISNLSIGLMGMRRKKIVLGVCAIIVCVCEREREIMGARDSDRKQLEEATADQSLVL